MNEQERQMRDYFMGHNAFLDKEKLSDIADAIAISYTKDALEEEEQQARRENRLTTRSLIKIIVGGNFDIIFKHAQSPIEKIFLCALNWTFAAYAPFHVSFLAPQPRAEGYLPYLRNKHQWVMSQWQAFREETGDEDWSVFVNLAEQLYQKSEIPEEEFVSIRTHLMFYHHLNLYNRYHCMPQPQFESYKVRNRSIRPDLLIWVPSKPAIKIVVECDGYNYHSDKDTFSRDRARDRLLQRHGYQVHRFSGAEIVQDPFGKAEELCDYLIDLDDDDDETPLEQEQETEGE
jgi:very-short-patch-repair endonuclease